MANYSSPPTDAQIVDAFTTYAANRADAGVVVAKAVAEVGYDIGKVSIILDPGPGWCRVLGADRNLGVPESR